MSESNNHKCIERAVDSDCPICNEYLFNSPKSVTFMQCGHSIHLLCFEELKKTAYRCPLCNKSCVNMEYRFRQIDMEILRQPMPPDYADARAVISCNDCCAKSQTAFHWLGLKCAVCSSYNTTQLQLLNMPGGEAAEQPSSGEQQQQPVALDPAFLLEEAEEIRRRHRAARREQERQQRGDAGGNYQGLGFIPSSSPSSYSAPAFLTRFLTRATSSEPEQQQQQQQQGTSRPSSSRAPASPPLRDVVASTSRSAQTAGGAACHSEEEDEDDDDDEDDDMLDLFGARDRDFDRMTGLTSAESAVGFDEEEEEEESSDEEDDEEADNEEEEEEEDEDDILLFGHR